MYTSTVLLAGMTKTGFLPMKRSWLEEEMIYKETLRFHGGRRVKGRKPRLLW